MSSKQQLTSNPNARGLGRGDIEIAVQDPLRVQDRLFFLASLTTNFFCYKKRNNLSRFN